MNVACAVVLALVFFALGLAETQPSVPAPIRVAFTPSRDPTLLQAAAGQFAEAFGKLSGLPVKVVVASDYAGVVEALRSRFVEMAFVHSVGYVYASREAGCQILAKATRRGAATYTSRIFVRQASGIRTLQELRGKRIAFVDPTSTSGYIYPMVLLIKAGLVRNRDPKTFFGEAVFAGSHDAALLALLNGAVDAAAVFDDAPQRLLPEKSRAAELLMVAESPRIPNDGVCVRQGLPAPLVERLTRALLALNRPEHRAVLLRLYNIDGLILAKDQDYDPVREAVDALSLPLKSR
jgi:phosphonate transport system substrate-binding protein